MGNPSVPELFVYVWSQVEAMPNYSSDYPFAYTRLKQEATNIIENALRSALQIADQVMSLKQDHDAEISDGEGKT